MADIQLAAQSAPSTPSSGNAIQWVDSIAEIAVLTNDTGRHIARSTNASIAAQGAGFATDTWVTNSDILIPSFSLQAKTTINWAISASKSGAGTAAPIYVIRIGTARSVADTAILTLTGPAQTAIADIGTLNINIVMRTVGGGTSAVMQGTAFWNHRGTAANTTTSGTGFANDSTGHVEGTSAGFNSSTMGGGSYVSLSINGGTSASWTLTQCQVEADW